MEHRLYSFPEAGQARYTGIAQEAVDFTLRRQLYDRALWQRFVDVFRWDSDSADNGWRCEYWGKTMRGGCLTYQVTGDEELYDILEDAVKQLLSAQRENGSFSTYPEDDAFRGWDVWGRKYVLTGLLHFYRICRDEALRERVLAAATAHAHQLFDCVGPGKKDITQTSTWWGGVNSCSILEPVVDLYQTTGDQRCLDFARYILSAGGCRDGNLIQLAAEDQCAPYEYPETKAYETMSFFEGLLALYEATGEGFYLETVQKFAAAVMRTDITVIGSAGCTHELFDHSALRQTEETDGIMQETCVTVTWMRLCARLFRLTGGEQYIAQIERSAFNGLYGAVNKHLLPFTDRKTGQPVGVLPFDSYSPLTNQRRGRGAGGLKFFRDGSFYGCCACIASAGTALVPLTAFMSGPQGIACNLYLPGTVALRTPSGGRVRLTCVTSYPADANVSITVETDVPEAFPIKLRFPSFFRSPGVQVNGSDAGSARDGYVCLEQSWFKDEITLRAALSPEETRLNGKTAFTFGPLVLARDARKESAPLDLPLMPGSEPARAKPEDGEQVRFLFRLTDGRAVPLTDYASCGGRWDGTLNRISVWHDLIDAEA